MKQRPRAFTLLELLIVIAIIGILMALLMPMAEKAREKAYITACAANLHSIGQALTLYCDANRGQFPRTTHVAGAPLAVGTGAAAPDPFGAGGPSANDCSSPLWLLARVQHVPTKILICAYDDENEFSPDAADPARTSNFTSWKKSLGYSYANPYPDAAATVAGYKLTGRILADFAVAADLNPGISPRTNPTTVRPGMADALMKFGNSINHERKGQNVLYADGHAAWQATPFCGHGGDNIYASQRNKVEDSPVAPGDSVLLPDEQQR